MKSLVRVVKRGEREANECLKVKTVPPVHQKAPELVIKDWIRAFRKRRRAEEADRFRNLARWRDSENPAIG
jgi:hypothetical protein